MNYKIRDCLQNKKIPYVIVVGDKEIETGALAIRKRGVGQIGEMVKEDFIEKLITENKTRGFEEIK